MKKVNTEKSNQATPRLGHLNEPETERSITDWSLLASVHQEPVPSHLTAAGSCAQSHSAGNDAARDS
jgi:hypothetical protein